MRDTHYPQPKGRTMVTTTDTIAPLMKFETKDARIDHFKMTATGGEGAKTVFNVETPEGENVVPTERFLVSLCSRYSKFGINMKLIKAGLFTPAEVFDRLSTVAGENSMVRYTVQRDGVTKPKLLACVATTKPVPNFYDVMATLEDFESTGNGAGDRPEYLNGKSTNSLGIIRSMHTPARLDNFDVGGDAHQHKLCFEVPIDGYGKPKIYLAMLRLICQNGLIGLCPSFTSEISVGKKDDNTLFALQRALETFSNDEGFAALRNRLDSSTESWASVAEATSLYKIVSGIVGKKQYINKGTGSLVGTDGAAEGLDLLKAFDTMTGDIAHIYGIAHTDAMSRKRMERLAVSCTTYDLVNYATEVATHYTTDNHNQRLHAYVGELLGGANEFDLEGSCNEFPNFRDFFMQRSGNDQASGNYAPEPATAEVA